MEPINNSPKLPRLLFLFFKWYCQSEKFEELHGDLEELYIDRLEELGKTRAVIHYAWDVLRCCQPYAWKKLESQLNSNTTDMLKNYLRIAVRHLLRKPGYAALNIFGLTLGMVASLIILLYLNQELSFDEYHENADRIYRVSTHFYEADGTNDNWATTQRPLGQTVKETFAEVDQYVRFMRSISRLSSNNINYMMEDVYMVDSTVFDVFTYEFLKGDPKTALNQPNAICLSESEAQRIFKDENPMGELLVSDNYTFEVTGVYKDQPKNSHIIANALASASTDRQNYRAQRWGSFGIFTYLLLNPTASADVVEDKLNNEIMDKYIRVIFDRFDLEVFYEILPIRDIHLYSEFEGEPVSLGNIEYIYIFAIVAVFLIVIACINYMNLATARSMRRAMEVGVRKAMGAQRGSLIVQFIAESVVIASVSLVLSLFLLSIIVPVINIQVGTALDISQLWSLEVVVVITLILLVTGVLSGSYPAFYLSAFTPSKALRGSGAGKRSGNPWLRRGLVGLQFAISIFMLISTLVIYDQMQYLRNKNLGFDKDQVVFFGLRGEAFQQWDVLKRRLLQSPNISTVTSVSGVPGDGYPNRIRTVEKNDGTMEDLGMNEIRIDFDYFNTLGAEMAEGRNFSSAFSTDTSMALIVNEAMVRRLGWENPIGKKIQYSQDSTVFHRVIGVAKDFHQSSLHDPIEPLLFAPNMTNRRVMVRIDGNYMETLSYMEDTWESLFPNLPYESQFLDQNFVEFYENDQIRGNLFLGFSVIMIVIAALGLLGLASFTAEQRSKEISIRKVLGASIQGLISLLVKEFVILVMIGAVPAFVFAYWFAENWLNEFEFHVNINLMLFALVVVIITFVTVVTTGFHAFKVAQANPSENLKNE